MFGLVALLVGATMLGACRTECRTLCSAWYDYQRDECGVIDADDLRVRCIADYRTSKVTDDELAECAVREQELEEVREADDEDRSCLCDGDSSDCFSSDDDDSAWSEEG